MKKLDINNVNPLAWDSQQTNNESENSKSNEGLGGLFANNRLEQGEIQAEKELEVLPLPKGSSTALFKVTSLPSGFLPYPKGSEVYYRPWRLGEVQQYVQAESLTKEEQLKAALQAVSVKGFDKMDLSIFDLYYISLIRKLSAFGTQKVTFSKACPSCGKLVSVTVETLDLNFGDFNVPELPIRPKFSNHENLEFGVLTVKGMLDILFNKKENDFFFILSRCVQNYKWDEVYKKILDLPSLEDEDLLIEVNKLIWHGLEPLKRICPHTVDEILPYEPTAGLTYKGLISLWKKGDYNQLNKLAEGSSSEIVEFSENLKEEVVNQGLSDLGAYLGLLYRQPCEELILFRPEVGDLTVAPFRESGRYIQNKIFFGHASSHVSS